MSDSTTSSEPSREETFKAWGTVGAFGFVLLCVIFGLFGSDDDGDGGSRNEKLIPMQGEIVVFDRTACADGPMLEIRADGRLEMPISYRTSPAPCRLAVDTEVPVADMYRFDIGDLPPMVIPYDRMIDTSASGQSILEVDFSWYP